MFAKTLMCSWIGTLGLAAGAFCQTYVPILVDNSIDTRCPALGCSTSAYSINNAGTVAGSYSFTGGFRGFVRGPDGTITTFDAPEGQGETSAFSINEEGAIAGAYSPMFQLTLGYIRDTEGNFIRFIVPGSSFTDPKSINAGGTVTGYYYTLSACAGICVMHGFVRRADGTLISFDPPGSINTQPTSINAKGAVTGTYQDANGQHGFVRRPGGEIESFDPPDSLGTLPASINYAGAITGSYTFGGRGYGFVRDPNGNFTRFDPGTFSTNPTSINDEGAITGNYIDNIGVHIHGFVRSPGGTITSFDAPAFCLSAQASPTSINDKGVITGLCGSSGQFPGQGSWVRFP